MARYFIAAVILAGLALPVFADSIDDAEAKRRGILVAQAVAERQLATEKAKGATLEKQLVDLKKQLADLQASNGVTATPGAAPGAARGTTATPAARGTPAAPKPGTFTGTQNRDGTQSITVTPAGSGSRTITFTGTFDENGVMRPSTQPASTHPKP